MSQRGRRGSIQFWNGWSVVRVSDLGERRSQRMIDLDVTQSTLVPDEGRSLTMPQPGRAAGRAKQHLDEPGGADANVVHVRVVALDSAHTHGPFLGHGTIGGIFSVGIAAEERRRISSSSWRHVIAWAARRRLFYCALSASRWRRELL